MPLYHDVFYVYKLTVFCLMTLAIACIIFVKHQVMECRVNYEFENIFKEMITD